MAELRVVIIDDEPPARQRLRDLLAEQPDVTLIAECADGASGLAAILQQRPDIVFADVRMPRVSGIEVIAAMPVEERPAFVLVTAYAEHAPAAFDVAAVDYLLKPFDDERFRTAFERAAEHVRLHRIRRLTDELFETIGRDASLPQPTTEPARYQERLIVEHGGDLLVIPVEHVDYIQASGSYVIVHVGADRYVLRERMKALESRLDPGAFCRIHRSTLVRIDRIEQLKPHWRGDFIVRLRDGTQLKLSRGRKPALERALGWG